MRSLFRRSLRRLVFPAAAFVIVCCCHAAAHADPLVLTLTNPNQTITPFTPVTFLASATNTGAVSTGTVTVASIFLSPDSQPGGVSISFDFTPFINNFQNQTVASGGTLGPLPLFTMTMLGDAPPGSIISGSVALIYTNSQGERLQTDAVPFTATVGASVPEPATMLLLGTGLAGVGAAVRKRGKRQA